MQHSWTALSATDLLRVLVCTLYGKLVDPGPQHLYCSTHWHDSTLRVWCLQSAWQHTFSTLFMLSVALRKGFEAWGLKAPVLKCIWS